MRIMKNIMTDFNSELWKAAKQGPQLYFASLFGFCEGVRSAWQEMDTLGGTSDDTKLCSDNHRRRRDEEQL